MEEFFEFVFSATGFFIGVVIVIVGGYLALWVIVRLLLTLSSVLPIL